jgi:hypothetical protein
MSTAVEMKAFDVAKVASPLEDVFGGDLAIGTTLQDWVSGETSPEDIADKVGKQGQFYVPLIAISRQGFLALTRLQDALLGYSRITDFERATRYTCVFTNMEFWALVPLGILTKDAKVYQPAFSAPGAWTYGYDLCVQEGRERYLEQQLGNDEIPLEIALSSVALSMMGSGYHLGCLPSDGSPERKLVTVDLVNGDKLICATWVWYNN